MATRQSDEVPRCEATAPATTYTPIHRCTKVFGLERLGRRLLCAHHRPHARRKAA